MSSDRGTFVRSGKAFGEVVPMEKDIREEYAGSMWGFSKKRFLITLGLSMVVWVITNFIQLFNTNYWPSGVSLLGGSCTVTGYPVALCLASYEKAKISLVYIVNIAFWFWVIHLFSSFLFRSKK